MALVADYTKIKGFKSRCYRKVSDGYQLNPITRCLVLCMIWIHMDEITEKNHKEFFTRLSMYQKAFGAQCEVIDRRFKRRWRSHMLTLKDVRDHIGLTANVMPRSSAYFNRQLIRLMRREAEDATL